MVGDMIGLIFGGKILWSFVGRGACPLVEKMSFMPISHQLGCIIPNIHVNLDASFQTFMSHWTIFLSHCTFLVILDNVAKDHVFY